MKKNIDRDAAGNSEGFFNPELLFCADALVVDYLNALLESEPALNMDFREIHFVHQEMNSHGNASSAVGNKIFIESEYLRTEADDLRSENEGLKFKTELALIDAQVLRTENNKLKIDKERLITQLIKIKEKLDIVRAENESLRQTVKADRHNLKSPTTTIMDQNRNAHTESAVFTEIIEGEVCAAPELTASETIAEQEILPEPAVAEVVEECLSEVHTVVLTDEERFILTGVTALGDNEKKVSRPEVSLERMTSGISRQDAQPFSIVIKHLQDEENNPRKQSYIVKAASPDAVPLEKPVNYAHNVENITQHQQVVDDKCNKEVTTPAANTVMDLLKDVDEIDMPPEPASKVVIRRNVKNYEDLQKESNSNKTANAGHDLIL